MASVTRGRGASVGTPSRAVVRSCNAFRDVLRLLRQPLTPTGRGLRGERPRPGRRWAQGLLVVRVLLGVALLLRLAVLLGVLGRLLRRLRRRGSNRGDDRRDL